MITIDSDILLLLLTCFHVLHNSYTTLAVFSNSPLYFPIPGFVTLRVDMY